MKNNYRKASQQSFISLVLFLVLFSFNTEELKASCSCSVGSNGQNLIGIIYQANTCPDVSGAYTYDEFYVQCTGGTITIWLLGQQNLYSGTPESMINNHSSSGDIVLRNPDGTNLFIVVDYPSSNQFNGYIEGVNTNGLSSSEVHYGNPPERLNKYCFPTYSNTTDGDTDGFPDCLDCAPADSSISYNCPACVNEQVAQCGSTDNALNWRDDPEKGCIGTCKDKNLGNCP